MEEAEGMFVPSEDEILRESRMSRWVLLGPEKGSCCTPTIAASYQTAIAAPRGCLFETGTRCNEIDLPNSRSGLGVVGTNIISSLTSRITFLLNLIHVRRPSISMSVNN